MDIFSLPVSVVSGIIGGVLAILFDRGVRRMLAPFIIKRKLIIGSISKSIYNSSDYAIKYWCVPVHVKASPLYNLLVASVEDVTASITFIHMNQEFEAVWVNANFNDSVSINLRIGTEREIGVLQEIGGQIRRYTRIPYTPFIRDEDIMLELKAGDTIIGHWLFKNAVVMGKVQTVVPIRVSR